MCAHVDIHLHMHMCVYSIVLLFLLFVTDSRRCAERNVYFWCWIQKRWKCTLLRILPLAVLWAEDHGDFQSMIWSPGPEFDGSKSLRLWEVTWFWGWDPCCWGQCLYNPRSSLLSAVLGNSEALSVCTQKRVLGRSQRWGPLSRWLLASQSAEGKLTM